MQLAGSAPGDGDIRHESKHRWERMERLSKITPSSINQIKGLPTVTSAGRVEVEGEMQIGLQNPDDIAAGQRRCGNARCRADIAEMRLGLGCSESS